MTQGIFGNQATGSVPSGVFGNQATGLGLAPRLSKGVFGNRAPDSSPGLSGTGGIFTGPTALGTMLSLGATKAQNDQCKLNCMSEWAGKEDGDYYTALCQQNCDYNYPVETTIVSDDDGTSPWYSDGGGSQTSYDASAGQACNSDPVIRMVQAAIGAAIDGKWGPESQSKLAAAGGDFKAFAPSCTGAVPTYAASSGGGTVTPQVTPGTTQPSTTQPASQANMLGGLTGFFTEKFLGFPMWAWGLTIGTVVGVSIFAIRAQR